MAGAGAEEGGMRIRWRGQGPAATSSQPDAPRHPVPSMDDAKSAAHHSSRRETHLVVVVGENEGGNGCTESTERGQSLVERRGQPARPIPGFTRMGSVLGGPGMAFFELPSAPLRRQPRAMAQARCTSVLRLRGRRAPSVLRHASPPRAHASPAVAPRERWPHQARQRPVPGPGAPR